MTIKEIAKLFMDTSTKSWGRAVRRIGQLRRIISGSDYYNSRFFLMGEEAILWFKDYLQDGSNESFKNFKRFNARQKWYLARILRNNKNK